MIPASASAGSGARQMFRWTRGVPRRFCCSGRLTGIGGDFRHFARERINNSLDATPFVVFESGTRFLFRSGGKTIGSGGHANPAKHLESALTSNKSSRTTFRLRPSSLSNRERTSIVLPKKMKPIIVCLFLLVVALPDIGYCDELKPEDRWPIAVNKLFGTWVSVATKGLGDDTKVQLTFSEDGSIRTRFTMGGHVDDNKGIYTVGKSHIYFWAGGPPEGVEVEDPDEHHQAMLMTYKIDGGKLKLTILDGADRAHVTLRKTKGEQDGAEQPATALESKPEGKKKPKPESEGRSQ